MKPDDVSQEAWDAAQSVAIDFINWADKRSADSSLDPDAEHVLAKILAHRVMFARIEEREACAKIADDFSDEVSGNDAGYYLAQAIRSRT